MTTTPRLLKSQTQVNFSDAASPQLDGQVTFLSDGGYVVAWTNSSNTYNTAGSAIVAQRYDALGNKVGGDPLHGGEVKISQFSTSGNQFAPAIATLANGNVAVAYVSLNLGDNDIYVRVFNSSLNSPTQKNIDVTASQTVDPSLTAFADGSYVVSYTLDNGGGNKDIVAKIVSNTGFVGAPITVNDNGTLDTDFSALATLSNNNFVDVWQRNVSGDHDIYFSIYTSAGAPVISVAPVTGGFSTFEETDPDVAALRDGGFVVVWTDGAGDASGSGIRATIMSNTGANVAPDFLVNTTQDGQQNEANVVGLRDGGFLVTWEDDNAFLIRSQRFDALGHKIGAEFTVRGTGPLGTDSPEAAVLADGHIAYAFSDFSNDADVATSIWTTGWNAVARGDFNGDGTDDVLWQNAIGNTAEWLMSPGSGIANDPATPAAPGWSAVASGDFNGDGTDDILWRNDATGSTAEWLMAPTGGVGTLLSAPPVGGWNLIASGDFNGDGTDDLMWQNAGTGATSEWLMAGGGVASNPFTPAAPGWNVVATGDFNNDGTADLMWKHAGTGATSEWLMAPTGGVGTLLGTPAAPGWNVVATGDFNNDGTADLMWKHAATGSTAEWLMAPTGGVGSLLSAPPVGGWNLIASGDFNGDGTDDLMWQNAATGATSEWLMAGGSVASNPFTPAAPGWDVVATGDFNGDATIDLMWQSALNGATAEWLMAPGAGGVGAFVSTLTM